MGPGGQESDDALEQLVDCAELSQFQQVIFEGLELRFVILAKRHARVIAQRVGLGNRATRLVAASGICDAQTAACDEISSIATFRRRTADERATHPLLSRLPAA
jgi:hypothetical protein